MSSLYETSALVVVSRQEGRSLNLKFPLNRSVTNDTLHYCYGDEVFKNLAHLVRRLKIGEPE